MFLADKSLLGLLDKIPRLSMSNLGTHTDSMIALLNNLVNNTVKGSQYTQTVSRLICC